MNKTFCLLFFSILFYSTITAPQQSEINDQLQITDTVIASSDAKNDTTKSIQDTNNSLIIASAISDADVSFTVKAYNFFAEPLHKFVKVPKVNEVLRNIGTCLVNGAMELFSFYLPPTFMPLVASAAGFMIPFEPVMMLKERMPVNTYRRAFKTAMRTFLNTFDQFKMDDGFDPYMTRRFNRRLMNDDKKTKEMR